MSVFTPVTPAQLDEFLLRYTLGKATALSSIAAGVTNSNYYLDTEAGQFILTLYEHHGDDDLDYILGLQQHLGAAGVACATPVCDRRGAYYSTLNQRPAAIIKRVGGEVIEQPGVVHCLAIGEAMASFHLGGQDYRLSRPNPRGPEWCLIACDMLGNELDASDLQLIGTTLADYRGLDLQTLPCGSIHADLFHDNALFDGDALGGIIDFDYACDDSFVFDIAVSLNDWAIDANGELVDESVQALLKGYQQLRSLQANELAALPLMMRLAALRFWLSRLYDRVFPPSGELILSKCPDEFRRMLVMRSRAESIPL